MEVPGPERPLAPAPERRGAAVIPIHGAVDGVLADTFVRRLEEALKGEPAFIILDMDTWGGELHAAYDIAHAVRKITDEVVSVAYVSEKAISAGALISLSCNAIAMRPGTILGDCEAILVADGEIKTAPEKIKTTLRATFRDFAERAGYPPDLAVAMVDKDHEVVKVQLAREGAELDSDAGFRRALAEAETVYVQRRKLEQWPDDRRYRILHEETAVFEGNLLTMNHTQASSFGFCRWVVDSREALLERLSEEHGVALRERVYEQTGWEQFVSFLAGPEMRALLMFIGLLGLMIEFYHPGMLVPGAVGVVCLSIAFFSGHLVGVVDILDIALLVVGAGLVLAEILVIPGFGIVGILGGLCLLAGGFLSLQSFTLPTTNWEVEAFKHNLEVFLIGLIGTTAAFAVAVRFLPKSPLLGRIVLEDSQKVEDGYTVGSARRVALIGRRGVAVTALRPAGKVEVGDELVDAVSEGEFIEQGTPVVIEQTDANRVVVRPAGEEDAA